MTKPTSPKDLTIKPPSPPPPPKEITDLALEPTQGPPPPIPPGERPSN